MPNAKLVYICQLEQMRLGNTFDISVSNEEELISYCLRGEGYLNVFLGRDEDGKDIELFAFAGYDNPGAMTPVFQISENGRKKQFEDEYLEIPVQMRKIVEGYSAPAVRSRMGLQTDQPSGTSAAHNREPERKPLKKLFAVNQSFLDAYFITVKKRLKDYFVAANTIPYLPVEQQASAKNLVKMIDSFICNRLFDTVRNFIEMDKARNKCDIEIIDNWDEKHEHRLLYAKYFLLMDYALFQCNEQHGSEQYFTDISLMSHIRPEEVLPVLQNLSTEFDLLSRCTRPADLSKVFYFKNVYEVLLVSTRCAVNLSSYDVNKSIIKVCIQPQNEMQTTAIMSYLESNWEIKPNECSDTLCRFGICCGVPTLILTVCYSNQGINGEAGFVPRYMSIQPTPDFEPYGGGVNLSDVPQEFFDMINCDEIIAWVEEKIRQAELNGGM